MSRSRRKNPYCGNAKADSEKEDKRLSHKKFRRKEKEALFKEEDPPERLEEAHDTWDYSKDGKQRFDSDKYPELMRK